MNASHTCTFLARAKRELTGSTWRKQIHANTVDAWADHYICVDKILRQYEENAGGQYGAIDGKANMVESASSEYSIRDDSGDSTTRYWRIPNEGDSYKRQSGLDLWGKLKKHVETTSEKHALESIKLRGFVEKEVHRSNEFCEELYETFSNRMDQLQAFTDHFSHLTKEDQAALKEAFRDTYMAWLLLYNFCSVNKDILHRVGMFLYSSNYLKWISLVGKNPPYFIKVMHTDIPDNQVLLSSLYARAFKFSNVKLADADLKQRVQKPLPAFKQALTLGLTLGACLPMMLIALILVFQKPPDTAHSEMIYAAYPVFRGTAVICLTIFLWAICTCVMERLNINATLILNVDPSTQASWLQLLEISGILWLIWLACFCMFTFQANYQLHIIPPAILDTRLIPCAMLVCASIVFLWPFDMLHRATRLWIIKQVLQVMASPFVTVTFASNFVGDYLTSLVKVLIDFAYSMCFYGSGAWRTDDHETCRSNRWVPFSLTILPLVWRLLQCARRFHDGPDNMHLLNFGKYSVSVTTVVVGMIAGLSTEGTEAHSWLQRIYLFLLIASTIYSFCWDVIVDWGFFMYENGRWKKMPPNRLDVLYDSVTKKGTFHVSMHPVRIASQVLNLLGRCAWAYTLVTKPPGDRFSVEFLVFSTAMIEIIRRSHWALRRFANEHLNNCGRYRVVKEIPDLTSQCCMKPVREMPLLRSSTLPVIRRSGNTGESARRLSR